MRGIHRITCAGIVHVVAVLTGNGAVVREIVDPLKRQRRAQLVTLGGVVIDHVEDHLDTGIVEGTHHVAEPLNAVRATVARCRREEVKSVIAPEVFQPPLKQMLIVRERMYRQQLNGGHAEAFDVIHRGFMPHPLEGAAQFGRDRRVELGKALHVGFIQNRAGPGHRRAMRVLPVEHPRVDDPAFWRIGCAVAGIKAQIEFVMPQFIAKMGGVPDELPGQRPRIRVNQQLMRVKTVPVFRIVRAIHAVAVQCARFQIRHIAVPDFVGVFR